MSKKAGKPKSSRSLVATLASAFLALSLAALLIANLSLFFIIGRVIQESVNSEQKLVAQEAAITVASFIQEKLSVLESAVKFGDPTSATQEEQKRTLDGLLGLDRAFRQLVLLDAQGQALVKVSRVSQVAVEQLMDRVDTDLLTQVQQGDRTISPVYIDEMTSEPMVIMAVPALDIFGDSQGTLLAEVNLKFMWDLVDRLEVGEAGQAYVVDRQGRLIAFHDVSRVLQGEEVAHLRQVAEFIGSPAEADETGANISSGIDGTTTIGTYVPLGMPDWAVVTELPLAEAFRPGIQSTMIAVPIMLVLAVVAGLSAVYIARRLAAPLLNLTETATQITGGEIGVQATLEGPTEVASLALAFNSMTAQLRGLIDSLEQQVAERTADLARRSRYLEATADVARDAASILEVEELLDGAAALVGERFGFYHTGVFLLDPSGEWAVLQAASSEGGQRMLARGHRLRIGQGIVGSVAQEGAPRVALDVGQDAAFFDNPDLPETRSEMALPLRARGEVIGVLDVQSQEPEAFSDEDVAALQTLADQVAVAISNARLFGQVQESLEAERRAYGELSRQAWRELLQRQRDLGFLSDERGISSAGDVWRPEMEQALHTGQTIQNDGEDVEGRRTLAVPIKVRGQVVGVLDTYKPAEAGGWTPDEIALLETIAEQLDSALETARLYQDTQRRAVREQAIRQVTDRMRRSVEVEAILQNTVAELAQALGAPRAYVRLGTEAELLASRRTEMAGLQGRPEPQDVGGEDDA